MGSGRASPGAEQEGASQSEVGGATVERQERLLAWLLVLFAVAFNLYHLYPEIAVEVPFRNDGVLHLLALQQASTALADGRDITDPWVASVAAGYPLLHHYQHLPYVLPALLHLPLRHWIELRDTFDLTRYLLLSLFPLSVYWSVRRFGFSLLAAGFGALIAPLISTDGLYGLGYSSYVWGGYGLYTQLWGVVLLPPALAQAYTALREGKGYFWAVPLLGAALLSHLVVGYIALVTILLFVFLPVLGKRAGRLDGDDVRRRLKRVSLLLALVALVTAYFLLPFLLDSPYLNRSVWEEQGKYDSYGYEWVLDALLRGHLFDFGRFPSLTILAAVGLGVCAWRWRDERYRVPVALFLLWLLLYFGRTTWGALLNLLPLSGELHLHRLILGVHLGGIYLMGLGLALPWRWALRRNDVPYLLPVAVLTAALLCPIYWERGSYLGQNARWMVESETALAAEEGHISALLQTLQRSPPGRVYAGLGGNWGQDYEVGDVPMYALLNGAGLDTLGYLYHALSLNADVQVLFDEERAEHYNLFNVRYIVAPAERTFPPFVTPLGEFGRHRLYEVQTTGYFDLVGSDASLLGDKGDFYQAAQQWLESDLPSQKQHPAVLFRGVEGYDEQLYSLSEATSAIVDVSSPPESSRGRVISETVEENTYSAKVEVERESMLVLKATYHPNWHAYVDGAEADTVMLMPSYVGLKLTPGSHAVRLEYRPRPVRRWLSVVALIALPAMVLAEWRRERLARAIGQLGLERLPALARLTGFQVTAWGPYRDAKDRLRPHLPYLGAVVLMGLLAGLPLLQLRIMSGHDALEYLPRAVEFYQGLAAGQLLPRWAPDLSGGYGQPLFNFNPPLFYYVSALFHALGSGFVASQNLACFALLQLAGLGMYLLGADLFGPRGGLVSAVAYLFAPYLLATLYVRHALADFSAFAFIPLAFWGLYRFATGGQYRFVLLGAVSVALLSLASNPVALMTFPALLLLTGWLAAPTRAWRTLLRGLWCLLLGVGLSAFFWLPALAEREFVHLSRLLEGYLSYRYHFVYPHQLIYSPWGYGLSLPGPVDGMSFAIGPLHLLLLCASLVLFRRIPATSPAGRVWVSFCLVLVLLAAFLACTPSLFLWESLPLLQYLAFPWRFLSLLAAGAALICGLPFLILPPERTLLARGSMVVLVASFFLLGFTHAKPESFLEVADSDYTPEAIAARDTAVTSKREYEPIWVTERPGTPAAQPSTVLRGEACTLGTRLSPVHQQFNVRVSEEATLQVNTFYFPGWTLYVDGAQIPIDYSNAQGAMQLTLPQGDHLVQLVFADTPVRTWSTRVSLLALLALLITPWLLSVAPKSALGAGSGV
jgi:uncharacterized membrane protein